MDLLSRSLLVGFVSIALTISMVLEAATLPNVVLIMADDLGYGDLGCYDGWIDTPSIDRLASEGLRMTDFHSNCPVCSPTRAALMTGRYQQRAGIPGVIVAAEQHASHLHGLHDKELTAAEIFAAAGYATGIFGKWHLGYRKQHNPTLHGFDSFIGYISGNIDFISHVTQVGKFDWWRNRRLFEEEGYTTQLITRHAVEFIEDNKDLPFFLYLPHQAPHYPYQGPNDKADRMVGDTKAPMHGSRKDQKEAYREMVEVMDIGIGQVLETLRRCSLEENTIVVFCSDNGATRLGSNGILRGFKAELFEGGHRVPCIVRWPGKVKAGGKSAQLSLSMDLLPTLLALAGIEPPLDRTFDGVDLSQHLQGGENSVERKVFWGFAGGAAMRDGDWKLLQDPRDENQPVALFDLAEDPSEQHNLAESESDRVEMMITAVKDWRSNVAEGATWQPKNESR